MGGAFLEFMKNIGIFILCAQSFMHFAAGKAYEKYVKLLIGVMILGQFVVPVRAIFLGGENAQMWEEIERFQGELEAVMKEADNEAADFMGQGGVGMSVGGGRGTEKEALEGEIKERLAEAAGVYGRAIEKVELKEEPPQIIVTVKQGGKGEGTEEKIKVEKITIGPGGGQDIEDMPENEEELSQELAAAFSKALGTDADYIKIIMK